MTTIRFQRAAPIWTAVLTAALCLTTAALARAQQAGGSLDLTYVPTEAVAAVVAHPRQIFTGEGADWLPLEILTAAGMKEAGFDPVQIEEAVIVFAPPAKTPDPEFGYVLRLAQPYSKAAFLGKLPSTKEAEESGQKFVLEAHGGPQIFGFYLPDDRTIVIGTETMLRHMIAAKNVESPLTKLMKKTDCSGQLTAMLAVEPVRDLLNKAMAGGPDLPAPLDQYKDLPNRLDSVVIQAHVWMKFSAELTLGAKDSAGAESLEQWLQQSLEAGRQMMLAKIPQPPGDSADPVAKAQRQYLERMTQQLVDSITPIRKGADVNISMEGGAGIAPAAMMAGLLLPAIQAAQKTAERNRRNGQ